MLNLGDRMWSGPTPAAGEPLTGFEP
jgi:hypothetical protein